VVDASVWIAAQDKSDPNCMPSRRFFAHVIVAGTVIHVPAYARLEVACAVARKLRNAAKGQRLTNLTLTAANAKEHLINSALLTKPLATGTARFLRGADALYAATADLAGCALVSWDTEHIQRAGASTPDDWISANS